MSAARVLALPTLVTPDDVQAQLQCSRSEAYAHLRACAVRYHDRAPEARTMLRVTRVAWDRYVEEVVLCGCSDEAARARGTRAGRVPDVGRARRFVIART